MRIEDINKMGKWELTNKREFLIKDLDAIDKRLKQMQKSLYLNDNRKTISKYSLSEENELLQLNPKAWDWMHDNKDKNIMEYNATHRGNQVVLENREEFE